MYLVVAWAWKFSRYIFYYQSQTLHVRGNHPIICSGNPVCTCICSHWLRHYLLQLRQLVVPSSTSWVTEAPPLPSRSTSTATGTSRETKMADSTCGTSGRWTIRLLSLPPAPSPRYRPFRRAQPVSLTHGSIQPCHADSRINWCVRVHIHVTFYAEFTCITYHP